MTDEQAEADLRVLLARAGVAVGGGRPWDIRVCDARFFRRAATGGSQAVGESYVDGWWDADRLDELFHRIFKSGLHERLTLGPCSRLWRLAGRFLGLRSTSRPPRAAIDRRSLGNDLFQAMLGRRMSNSCAYWEAARSLDEAVDAASALVCAKLELKRGMSVLDLGCGWGSFARYAAQVHGVSVTGVDIAADRVKLGRELCKGLPVALRVQDYKEVRGRFDRVVSLGLMEQVSPAGYRGHMAVVAQCLKADGIALVHTSARNRAARGCDPWLERDILLDGSAPTLSRLTEAMEGLFVVEDVHNLGPHCDPTLLAWSGNLERRWPDLRGGYGDRLFRTLKFQLLSSAGSFRARRSQLFQVVMTRPGRAQPRCRLEPSARPETRPAERALP